MRKTVAVVSTASAARALRLAKGESAVDVPLQPPVADGHGDREDQQRRAYDEGGDEHPSKDGPHRAENARLALGWLFSEPDVVVISRCLLHISRIGG